MPGARIYQASFLPLLENLTFMQIIREGKKS